AGQGHPGAFRPAVGRLGPRCHRLRPAGARAGRDQGGAGRRLAGGAGCRPDHAVRPGPPARILPAVGRPGHRGDLPAGPGGRAGPGRGGRGKPGGMSSPPAAPAAGGQQQRPKPKSGRPDGKTTGRHELSRHARFAEISPEVGVLDERAMNSALADDPSTFALLAAMTTATDEQLRAAAIRLAARIVLERARAGRPAQRGVSRLRAVRGSADGDLDLDASMEGLAQARAEARPAALEDLTTTQWARASTAFAVVVDRSGSMTGARLGAGATGRPA